MCILGKFWQAKLLIAVLLFSQQASWVNSELVEAIAENKHDIYLVGNHGISLYSITPRENNNLNLITQDIELNDHIKQSGYEVGGISVRIYNSNTHEYTLEYDVKFDNGCVYRARNLSSFVSTKNIPGLATSSGWLIKDNPANCGLWNNPKSRSCDGISCKSPIDPKRAPYYVVRGLESARIVFRQLIKLYGQE